MKIVIQINNVYYLHWLFDTSLNDLLMYYTSISLVSHTTFKSWLGDKKMKVIVEIVVIIFWGVYNE